LVAEQFVGENADTVVIVPDSSNPNAGVNVVMIAIDGSALRAIWSRDLSKDKLRK
jgi:hypothetical protein